MWSSDGGSSSSDDDEQQEDDYLCQEQQLALPATVDYADQPLAVAGRTVRSDTTVTFGNVMLPEDLAARVYANSGLTLRHLSRAAHVSRAWHVVVDLVLQAECHARALHNSSSAELSPAVVLYTHGIVARCLSSCLNQSVVEKERSKARTLQILQETTTARQMEHFVRATMRGNLSMLRGMVRLWTVEAAEAGGWGNGAAEARRTHGAHSHNYGSSGNCWHRNAVDCEYQTALMHLCLNGHRDAQGGPQGGGKEDTPQTAVLRYLILEAGCDTSMLRDQSDQDSTAWGIAVAEKNVTADATLECIAREGHFELESEREARKRQRHRIRNQALRKAKTAKPQGGRNLRLLGL